MSTTSHTERRPTGVNLQGHGAEAIREPVRRDRTPFSPDQIRLTDVLTGPAIDRHRVEGHRAQKAEDARLLHHARRAYDVAIRKRATTWYRPWLIMLEEGYGMPRQLLHPEFLSSAKFLRKHHLPSYDRFVGVVRQLSALSWSKDADLGDRVDLPIRLPDVASPAKDTDSALSKAPRLTRPSRREPT